MFWYSYNEAATIATSLIPWAIFLKTEMIILAINGDLSLHLQFEIFKFDKKQLGVYSNLYYISITCRFHGLLPFFHYPYSKNSLADQRILK